MSSRPTTLGELKASGWVSQPVKAEIRRNAIARIQAGEPLFPSILGYENTVLPQLENALLAGHDVIFLGERGQAKTRMIRSLTALLDEWLPVVAGSEINDDPYAPISKHARSLVEDLGDDAPIDWLHRDDRYGEKLATPDTSIADLIGEVDPIKIAEGRYLSDELVLHYGLVPRTNRGIFAINELPDLAERIQVGLLNVLEERDVQIRGFKIRLPLDLILFASANPEDYTNRGRIITPLKDRFGAQIRTHYPLETSIEASIMEQEAIVPTGDGVSVVVPSFMGEIIANVSQLARQSTHINQRSGVSVRLSVANYETLIANATRRTLRSGETVVAPRVSDLDALEASSIGKVEFETLDDGREGEILDHLVHGAVLNVFKQAVSPESHRAVVEAFEGGVTVRAGEDISSAEYVALLQEMPALQVPVRALLEDDDDRESPAVVASAVELVLEGLHLSKRLNKEASGGRSQYRSRA
jgi:magnesium chelatase subunit I